LPLAFSRGYPQHKQTNKQTKKHADSMTQKRMLPPGASGAIRPEIYKDPRTGLTLALGAKQNWPSSNDIEFLEREYRFLRAMQKPKDKIGPRVNI
jgi:hypothetical protein